MKRPMKKPSAPAKSPRSKANPMYDRTSPQFIEKRTTQALAKGGKAKISEYGGKEMYKSKAAMMKHEGKESVSMENKEGRMAKGGMSRGMGAAIKSGKFVKAG